MARSTSTRQGASARAGTSSSTRKTAARRAPAAASHASKPRSAKPKTVSRKTQPARKLVAASRRDSFPMLPIAIVVAVVLLGWFLYPTARLHYQEQRPLATLEQQLTQVRKRTSQLNPDV